MERMHPEDLRALMTASILGGFIARFDPYERVPDEFHTRASCEAAVLIDKMARTVKPVVHTLMACPLCGAATPSEALQPVQHTETCPLGAPYRAAKPTPEPVSSFKELHAKAKADGAKDERERLASLFSLVGREDVAKVIKESKP